MNHGNTMQELVMVKQQLETEQESLAEAIEAMKSSEEKIAQDEVWLCHDDCKSNGMSYNCFFSMCIRPFI